MLKYPKRSLKFDSAIRLRAIMITQEEKAGYTVYVARKSGSALYLGHFSCLQVGESGILFWSLHVFCSPACPF
jgi:hypothetical protein